MAFRFSLTDKRGKSEAGKMIEETKSQIRLRYGFVELIQLFGIGGIHFNWADSSKCKCCSVSKASFSSPVSKEHLLVEPLNHSTFAHPHLFEMQIEDSKDRRLWLGTKISMVQPRQSAPSVSLIHIYVHMQVVHTYMQ